jgi:hypothetical protein
LPHGTRRRAFPDIDAAQEGDADPLHLGKGSRRKRVATLEIGGVTDRQFDQFDLQAVKAR